MPCVEPNCSKNKKQTFDSNDYCNICWVESLAQAPVVQLDSCGHVFHYQCLLQKINNKWVGARFVYFFFIILRINFNYLTCPLCKKIMSSPLLKKNNAASLTIIVTRS